ncbi:hypothetical protein [Neisseria animaloris]|uniref:Uncharacterized protein n=1 Tax=Neisseria animaloris TaxID=326522 RepID=A0A3S5A5K8_9NEIS|nr:hypothetical protein [Neisseria animaloris]VEJ22248.1 Uncharacterised protein [Neisseria animaloris]
MFQSEDVKSIFLNIISSLIFLVLVSIYHWIRKSSKRSDPDNNQILKTNEAFDRKVFQDEKAERRKAMKSFWAEIFFYFSTYFILLISFSSPLIFNNIFQDNQIYLNQAQYIGRYLPEIPLTGGYANLFVWVVVLVLYVPILTLSKWLTNSLWMPIIDYFWDCNVEHERRGVLIFLALQALFLSACVQWLFFGTEFLQALKNVLIITLLAIIFSFAQNRH